MATKENQLDWVSEFEEVVTVEDHLIDGGLGSWMLEALSDRSELVTRIRIQALSPLVCGMVGRQSTLNAEGGLTRERLCG